MNPVTHYLLIDNERKGPFALSQLQSMWHAGTITNETLHHMDGYTDWCPLEYIREDLDPPPPVRQSMQTASRGKIKKKPNNPYPLIILFMLPLVGLVVLLMGINSVPPPTAAEMRAKQNQCQAVVDAVSSSGATMTTNQAGIHVITLPSDQALSITPRAAMELAIMARDRTGGIVRVVTPAGQVVAETE